ncbi:long-chain fatty acid--CoA ligase [Ornithinimicrobium humiphilum]|uniref:Acyl-CoA synthetase (AMP-forming)/AMP-acid ligase II n=1 Tax=Ornithinimicrobium humiphilum TaxID=125288 RepID=A0A543KRS8_9MICO|nr:AMP-binding protein [Ornithinimicrobium humiphilum]TQM97783.1 acyl-CoA synthetase (AMP-forming)/AMP-acid ligase II [Ornithinimicrobium humiphilum]
MNVGAAVARHAVQRPGAPAYLDPEGDVSYAELHERTNRLAHVLTDTYGARRGDRVALYVANGLPVIEVLVACAKVGAVYVGLNFRLDRRELDQILDNAGPVVLLGAAAFEDLLRPLCADRGIPYLGVDDPSPQGYAALLAGAPSGDHPARHDVRPEDHACIVYSSGTTGVPKGILFDHAAVLQHATVAALEYEIDETSRYLVQLPHNSSVNITFAPCLVRGAAIGMEDSRGFDPQRFAERVHRDAITHTFLVPTMLYRLLEQLEDDSLLDPLRVLGYGSSSIPADRVHQLVRRFGPKFVQLYGMAEIASIGTLLRREDHARAVAGEERLFASAGRASMGMVVRVVDPVTGEDVPVGERGEVIFGGPHVMRGYFRDEKRTAEAVVDGWMHSGDVGRLDEEGYLYIVDRIKDLIIRGGHNIAPKEIEEVLFNHPDVLEAAVVGVPDPEWGEALCAVVVPKEGRTVDAEQLAHWCREQGLASLKIPGRFVLAPDLPKNLVGKFDKKAIRAQVGG